MTNVARGILHESGPPTYLRDEALSTGTSALNGTATKALGGHPPYGVASRLEPAVAHLRAFGASCAVVEPMERLRKLAGRASVAFLPTLTRFCRSQSVGTRDVE